VSDLHIVLVEDNEDDAALLERHLRRSGMVFSMERVQTVAELRAALSGPGLPDVILADYNLPEFSGPEALQVVKAAGLDVPFIMMSGAVSEETAVASMRAGAHDYVSKGNLVRLVPAIDRELKEAATRRHRLATEQALKASEQRFHSLVEAMPLGLILSDAQGRIVYANRATERLLHYPQATLLDASVRLDDICSGIVDVCHSPGGGGTVSTEPFEAVCTTLHSHKVDVLIGVACLNPEAPAPERQLAAFIADLTPQKRSEELLRRTEKLAVAGRFAASISHEINNPLEAITNCLYLVGTQPIPDEARAYLEAAQKELDRVSQITVQTLRFHRASTRSALIDVEEVIETVLSLLDSRLRGQRIQIVRGYRSHPTILAHDGEIRQVVANLVGNAIDALPDGGRLVVRAARSRNWRTMGDGVVITVADTGTGMSRETSGRIFEPFFSTKGMTGTGLGLWVSSEIAIKHKGSLRVRSRPRQSAEGPGGTVFRFFFRAHKETVPPDGLSVGRTAV
jgi:signal transduction histidine kinase/CheY-like chemotaxis protein